MNLIAFVVALVCFILATTGKSNLGGAETLPLGLCFLTAGLLLGGWAPSWWKSPPG